MIIRVLGEGQYELADSVLADLEALDVTLDAAMDDGDAAAFDVALAQMLEIVHHGTPVSPERIVASDLVLPSDQLGLEEVRELLSSEEVG